MPKDKNIVKSYRYNSYILIPLGSFLQNYIFVDVKYFSFVLISFYEYVRTLFFHEGTFISLLCLTYLRVLEDSISSLSTASFEVKKQVYQDTAVNLLKTSLLRCVKVHRIVCYVKRSGSVPHKRQTLMKPLLTTRALNS